MKLTQAELRRHLKYDRNTGVFIRLISSGSRVVGSVAGSANKNGHRYISVKGRKYLAARLAWLYVYGKWPRRGVDHRDTCPSNDSIRNLREADQSQNGGNSKLYANNKSGFKGVFWRESRQHWRAQIKVRGKTIWLGAFDHPEEASDAYKTAAILHFGEFARWQ